MGYINIHSNVYVAYSEQELEDALNGATLTPTWGVKAKGNRLVFAQQDSGEIISAEAQAVLDRLPGLTATERTAIINFVNAESASLGNGNWALIDEFYCFALNSGTANTLIGFIAKTATNNGAVLDINGATFASAEYIDTNYNPSTDIGNFVLDNAQLGVFIKEYTPQTITTIIGGISTGRADIFSNNAVINSIINSNGGALSTSQDFEAGSLYVAIRADANNEALYINGVNSGSKIRASTSICNINLWVGGVNNASVLANGMNGTIATSLIGGTTGFDQAAHNTNLRAFLTELGTI